MTDLSSDELLTRIVRALRANSRRFARARGKTAAAAGKAKKAAARTTSAKRSRSRPRRG